MPLVVVNVISPGWALHFIGQGTLIVHETTESELRKMSQEGDVDRRTRLGIPPVAETRPAS